ncbi:MAG: GAP family protein [Gammaproteobacteria bacterium]
MLELLLTLTTISLLDSMSAVPIALIPLAIILNGRNPVTGSLGFISGGFIVYFIFGIFILLGLDTLIDEFANKFIRYMKSEPDSIELLIQILIGFLMIYFAWQFSRKSPQDIKTKTYVSDITPLQAFTLSASINVIGMWGALPYFAAIAQILKVDLTTVSMIWILLYYNFIFTLPLIGFIVLRIMMGDKATALLEKITRFFSHWGKQIFIVSLYLLGPLLIADGIGWFIDYPILDFTE